MKKLFLFLSSLVLTVSGSSILAANTNINALAIAVEGAATSVTADAYKGIRADVQAVLDAAAIKLNSSQNITGDVMSKFGDPHVCNAYLRYFEGTLSDADLVSLVGQADRAGVKRAVLSFQFCATGNAPRYQNKIINLIFRDNGIVAGESAIDVQKFTCFTNIQAQGDFQLKMEGATSDSKKMVADVSLILGPCYEDVNVFHPNQARTVAGNQIKALSNTSLN